MATLDRLGPPPSLPSPASNWGPRRAIITALSIVAVIALLQVVMSSSFTHTGAKLQTLEAQRSDLQAQIYDLEAEVAALASLERTERMARDRLGMIPARNQAYLSVSVEAPSGPLLPRPLLDLEADSQSDPAPWWRAVLEFLPRP